MTLGVTTRGALCALLLLVPAAPAAGQDERSDVVHLLQRATYGPRPNDVDEVLAVGGTRWLERQLHPEAIDDSAFGTRLESLAAVTLPLESLFRAYPTPRSKRERAGGTDSLARRRLRDEMRAAGEASPRRIGAELAAARLQRAVYSERQLEAVMTDFWFNRFNVYWGKGLDRWLVPDYEREAIRPHVFGRFEELLSATARHPAMLVYLDNARNAAPDVNENYARELLELHTLGVDGGYTQADVEAVARALSGWSIALRGEVPEFRFRSQLHDTGEKRFLGIELPAGRGIEDGEDVLAILARHPSTARHVARDLVEAFVSDDPPAALVDQLARVYLETGGDLREVTRTLFTAPEFYAAGARNAKVKSPFELVASALRLTAADAAPHNGTAQYLQSAGELPYGARDPIGYPETAEAWIDGGAMLERMNLALALASGKTRGVRIDAEALAGGTDLVEALAERLLPGGGAERVAEIVARDLAGGTGGGLPAAERALGLILGSPEFQRR
jgi:uncharacterized protein (DUF1800 family)